MAIPMIYDMRLSGGITGKMWWPTGAQGITPINLDLTREAARMDNPTLRELLLHVLAENGGNFQSSEFTADSFITVTSRKPGQKRWRDWELSVFPSIRDMLNPDVGTYDFTGE